MDVSWDICLHVAIALTSVGLTLTWERLRQHSTTIDAISKQTQYLTTLTYWTMIRLWKRMDTLEEEVHAIQMEGPDEDEQEEKDHNINDRTDPCPPPPSNVYTFSGFETNPFANGLAPWTMHDAPWSTMSYVPEAISDNDGGSVGDMANELECSDFADEDEEEDEEDEGPAGGEADSSGMSVGDHVGTDDNW